MDNIIEIVGKPFKTIFHNDKNLFTVALFVLDDLNNDVITVTGLFPKLDYDSFYDLKGEYVDHPRYGIQFQVISLKKQLPNSNEAVIKYLSSSLFKGIGIKTATAIVENIGENTLEKIKENPDLLDDVPRLSIKNKQTIIDNLFKEDNSLEKLMQFFIMHDINIKNISQVHKNYGDDAIEIIKENPYILFYECDGFGFRTADKLARNLNIDLNDERRLEALLLNLCNNLIMSSGDSYIEFDDLENKFKQYSDTDFLYILNKCIYRSTIILENEKVYTKAQYDARIFISEFLAQFPFETLEPYDEIKLENALNQIQDILNITYDDKQMEAIETFFNSDLMILTGGPGTGKTTVIRGIVHVYKHLYPDSVICCSAPTGRAVKRLKDLAETFNAITLHSLLKWDLHTNTFGKNEEDPLSIDLLIIDEFSMVDNWLFYNLLKASINIKKICIIGDEDQLPSVGPGRLLKDLIDTNLWPLVRLEHIFRQEEGSEVIKLAFDIKNNNVDFNEYKSDVAFYSMDKSLIVNNVLSIVQSALNKGYSINDIQVLSCMYKGVNGIDRLNINLQKCFNPPSKDLKELKFKYRTFRVNDKILQLKNQPDDNVYNGDIGTIVDIEYSHESITKQNTICVDFDGDIVEYTPENFINITHAYCISVHKSQGSEYPIVILPISMENYIMLEKRLIYTAITRAKKSVVILGDKDAFYLGINTKEKHIRKSDLTELIINVQKNNSL